MSANPCAERLAAFCGQMRNLGLDAAIVSGEANLAALTGVCCDSAALLLSVKGLVHLMTDSRYAAAVRRTSPWLSVSEDWHGKERWMSLAERLPGVRSVGYEGSMQVSQYLQLREAFPDAGFTDVLDTVSKLRAVKTPSEIRSVRAAVALNDEIWAAARLKIAHGMTEKEIQREIRLLMYSMGDGEAFDTIVCAGANAAECHHVPDSTVWREGEPLLVDMGVMLNGFCSDMTRNIVPASPSREYATVYETVLKANEAAIAALKPGMTGASLDKIARDIISSAGYGGNFGHSLGHGVGLEVHEAPVASAKSADVLKPGMLLTVEPGIYIENSSGVRIEDLVLVTESGCEVLTASPKNYNDCI